MKKKDKEDRKRKCKGIRWEGVKVEEKQRLKRGWKKSILKERKKNKKKIIWNQKKKEKINVVRQKRR